MLKKAGLSENPISYSSSMKDLVLLCMKCKR